MKKIFAVGMAALLLAGACTLAACDEEEENTANIVTAEEWAQAMNLKALDNYSVKTMAVDESGATVGEEGLILKFDGLKRYRGYDDGREYYYELTGEAPNEDGAYPCTTYYWQNGAWTVRENERVYWDDSGSLTVYTAFQYEEFTYDEEKDSYVSNVNEIHYIIDGQTGVLDNGEHISKVEIQFKDKKLAHFDFFVFDEEGKILISRMKIHDYGTTEVTLPDVPINIVTAQQWEDAMALKNIDSIFPWDNFTWKVTTFADAESTDDGEVMLLCKYDASWWYRYYKGITNEAGNYYITSYANSQGGERIDRVYESEDGVVWTYSEPTSDYFLTRDESGILAMYTSVPMEDFTYDAENGYYVAKQGVHMKNYGGDFRYTEFAEGQEMRVRFRYGKLICIEMITKYEGKTAVSRIEIYDYGTTKVTLPTVG